MNIWLRKQTNRAQRSSLRMLSQFASKHAAGDGNISIECLQAGTACVHMIEKFLSSTSVIWRVCKTRDAGTHALLPEHGVTGVTFNLEDSQRLGEHVSCTITPGIPTQIPRTQCSQTTFPRPTIPTLSSIVPLHHHTVPSLLLTLLQIPLLFLSPKYRPSLPSHTLDTYVLVSFTVPPPQPLSLTSLALLNTDRPFTAAHLNRVPPLREVMLWEKYLRRCVVLCGRLRCERESKDAVAEVEAVGQEITVRGDGGRTDEGLGGAVARFIWLVRGRLWIR